MLGGRRRESRQARPRLGTRQWLCQAGQVAPLASSPRHLQPRHPSTSIATFVQHPAANILLLNLNPHLPTQLPPPSAQNTPTQYQPVIAPSALPASPRIAATLTDKQRWRYAKKPLVLQSSAAASSWCSWVKPLSERLVPLFTIPIFITGARTEVAGRVSGLGGSG